MLQPKSSNIVAHSQKTDHDLITDENKQSNLPELDVKHNKQQYPQQLETDQSSMNYFLEPC